jgi:phenylalanyl-tRNA synthetase beta chain
VVRDLSLVVARSLPWADLAAAVWESAGSHLAAVDYLDTFQGGNLRAHEQSVHFTMTFRHTERTLTGEEVERAVTAVVENCVKRFGAALRG